MEGTDVNNPLSKMGPFLVYKGIQGISPSLDVKPLKNGTLLLECDRKSQTKTLEKVKQLGSVPIRVTPHCTLNSSQGVIRCRDLFDMPEEDIQLELAEQNITKVKRFMYKKDGQLRKMNTFVLTFDQAVLPDHI